MLARFASRAAAALALLCCVVAPAEIPRVAAQSMHVRPVPDCPPRDERPLVACPPLSGALVRGPSVLDLPPARAGEPRPWLVSSQPAPIAHGRAAAVPEASTIVSLGLGVSALAQRARRRPHSGCAASHSRATATGARPS